MSYTVHMNNDGKGYYVKLGEVIIEEDLRSRDDVISFVRRVKKPKKVLDKCF